MKKLFSILIFILVSVSVFAQESPEETNSTSHKFKYFIATNSGLEKTPVGFRIGILDRMGGYIATRFGKGYQFKEDRFNQVTVSEATLFSATAGLAFPITVGGAFKVHTYVGVGYGKWFDRPSNNGQTVGIELEGGFMLSYHRLMLNVGGNLLSGDGNPARKDLTLGVGFRF